MAYKPRYRRYSSRYVKKSSTNFIVTILIIGFLLFATLQWVLPTLIGGLGIVTGVLKPSHKNNSSVSTNSSLAPPVLNIPFEATNTAQININGYGTPNSKVALYLDDEKKDTVTVSDDGSFKIENIELVLGTNNIYAKSVDDKNLESLPSKTLRVVYDNEKPSLEVSEPEDGKSVQGERKLTISGKTEPQSQILINNSRSVVSSDGTFTTIFQLNDGENILTIKALDYASNESEIVRRVNFQP